MSSMQESKPEREITIPDTLITLVICFVIAMTFRGFVLEGFVIPTGSMAPTLLGEHSRWRSPETGYSFATDTGQKFLSTRPSALDFRVADPMLGRDRTILTQTPAEVRAGTRAGDRVLVWKWLYSFIDPARYDVIVFKNPTHSRENYIKRVVGLPGEELWLADGDVFIRPLGSPAETPFTIVRKPDHVQNAVWQPIFDSAYLALPGSETDSPPADPWTGAVRSETNHREYRIDGRGETILRWEGSVRPLDDWNAYNMFGTNLDPPLPVSDLRVTIALVPEADGLSARTRLTTREHIFELSVENGRARIRVAPMEDPASANVDVSEEIRPLRAGRVNVLEFSHVDQALRIRLNGDTVAYTAYDWDTWTRLENAVRADIREVIASSRALNPLASHALPNPPELELSFAGAPAAITRIAVDRDIYYRPVEGYDTIATHPDKTVKLGDEQFFMLGDNSTASADGRLWGEPDELVAAQVDPAPFIVNRDLIIGKAWSVYFPSPHPLVEGGRRFIPDFGRMRFIR
jgi:signal peptidase I